MKNSVIILFLLFFSHLSAASVVLIGTRVIYPEDKNFVNLNFRSSDNVPSIMELWVSKEVNSTDKNNNVPFVITPSIFRIDPNKGQSTKLILTDHALPNDRESVFYLNFLQLPASKKDVNKLVVTYKSTVKIFYRPSSLTQRVDNVVASLSVDSSRSNAGEITLFNGSEYYITPTQLSFTRNGTRLLSIPENKLTMVPPFSQENIKIKPLSNLNGAEASISLVNDLGGISTYKITKK